MKKFILQIKADAIPPDGVTKTVWADDDYEEIEMDVTEDSLPVEMQITFLKQKLADTDYISNKIIEGDATIEEYADLIFQRKMWRRQINDLQLLLNEEE